MRTSFLALLGSAILSFGPTDVASAQPLPGYANFEAFSAELAAIDKSDLVELTSLGKTLGGRDVYLLKITRSGEGNAKADEKPAILVLGNVYAPHLVGNELATRLAKQIVEKAGEEPYKSLVENYTLYVVPRPNPDATETLFVAPYTERALNSRPTDDDRDFKTDEDPNEDLNGDGWITMMRVEDPSGKWIPHPADDRVMIEADPKKNETGRYLLYSEGVDNDHDELWNEDGPGGVDFNRNFTFKYAFFTPGAGRNQVSELESRAVADFAFAHPNIAAVFSFSPQDNLLEPWKPGNDGDRIKTSILSADADRVNFLADEYRTLLGTKDWPSPANGEGDVASWAYFHYGRWSLSARAWWVPKVEPPKVEPPKPEGEAKEGEKKEEKPIDEKRGAEDINALRWFAANNIDGFVPWKAIEHPDFPGKKVEVGGFKPLLRLNPPAAELNGLAEKHAKFLGTLATRMPHLVLETPKVEPLGGGLFRVKARVINTGFLPTMSAMGKTSRLLNQLQLKLTLPEGAKLVTSSPRVAIDPLAGNGGSKEHIWLVNAAEAKATAATVRAWSSCVGSVEKGIELK